MRQLEHTKLFRPDEYDTLVEVGNREAYDMCLRLTREESLIAGPSSALALVGALKVIEDQPDAVVVIIFPDNVFKYASSFERHFPQVRPQVRLAPSAEAPPGEPSPKEQLLTTLVENSRNPHNTWEVEDLRTALEDGDSRPLLLDVAESGGLREAARGGGGEHPLRGVGGPSRRAARAARALDRPQCATAANLSISGMLFLQSLGYQNVRSLNGGTNAWAEQGLPTDSQEPAACDPQERR